MSNRPLTFRTRLFFAFLGLALVPLVGASFLAVVTTSAALREKVGTYSLQLVGQIALNLDREFQSVKGLTDEILISPEVNSRMVGYKSARSSEKAISRYIFTKLIQRKFLNLDAVDDVVMLFIPVADGYPSDVVHTADALVWPVSTLDRLARVNTSSEAARNLGQTLAQVPGTDRTDIVLVRPIRNSLADETLGHLLVVLDPDLFTRIYRGVDMGPGADLFVVDRTGRVVSSRHPDRFVGDQGVPGQWLTEGPRPSPSLRPWEGSVHLISLASVGTTGWTVVGAVPSSYLDSETGKIGTQVFLFSLVALMVALLVSLRISEGFTAPLRTLEKTMGLFGEGHMDARSVVGRDDEVGRLQKSFNAMAGDITGLLARVEEEHRRLQLSELRVMEYQINPHFLYNTLDSIHWMAQGAGQKEISAIVTALARFFRLSLSKGRETYLVRDELDHVKAFLSISQMRYPDVFSYEFDVDPSILDRRTLKIVLQPLVENAIKHGMDKKSSGGLVRISGRGIDGGLEWRVIDNGKGISEARFAVLSQRLASSASDDADPGGFGLVNVNHRVQLNYGRSFGLTLESTPGVGTSVRVFLPWEDENSNE